MDIHAERFHAEQSELLLKFRAIQATLLSGYEATISDAERGMAQNEPFAAVRYQWATQAAAELRERMGNDA